MTERKKKIGRSVPQSRDRRLVPISVGEIGTRIAEIADSLGSNSELAKICGVGESTVRNWRNGASEPTASHLVAMARAGGATVEWLASGALPKQPGQTVSTADYVAIPLYDIRSVKQQNDFFDAKPARQSIMLPRDWPRERAGVNADETLAFIHAHGDEMKPTLHDGDMLLIARTDMVRAKGIYAGFIDGFLFVQRLQRVGTELMGFSEEYPDRPAVPAPDFTGFSERTGIVGRIIWSGRRL